MRIAAIAERCGHRAGIQHHPPHCIIDAAGGDAGLYEIGAGIEDLGGQRACLAHGGKAFGTMQLDGAVAVDGLIAVNELVFVHGAHIAMACAKSYFASANAAVYSGLTAASTLALTGRVTS